jgi:hypothetical protein
MIYNIAQCHPELKSGSSQPRCEIFKSHIRLSSWVAWIIGLSPMMMSFLLIPSLKLVLLNRD